MEPTVDRARANPQPQVDPGRCVLAVAVEASCRECVAACPRAAWILDDGGLGLDTSSCDGCALCVAACPQHAIAVEREPPLASIDDRSIALVACEQAVSVGGKGVVPCLDAIGRDELAQHFANGVRTLRFANADCERCRRGGSQRFAQAARDVSHLLEDRGLPKLAFERRSAEAWILARDAAATPSRRDLFDAFRASSAVVRLDSAPRRPAALSLPSPPATAALYPFAAVIDADRCSACDACARICPTGAIKLQNPAGGPAFYDLDATRCTGCRLCTDVCDDSAVALVPWHYGERQRLDLDSAQCSACGNIYRIVEGRGLGARAICRICAATHHARNLFQVLE